MADMVRLKVPEGYGYCIIVAALSYFLLMWLGMQVGKMRKKTGIKYPTMYSDKDNLFNCYQRAHQNTLEVYPSFLCLLLLGGMYQSCLCAAAGLLWIASRVVYANGGYYTGDPSKRNYGAFGYIGLLIMLYSSVRAGLTYI
ncbi:microsomal glutathione S-transferase 3 [Hyalella azteca]|uniref:Glutathione S-transferase 3, mitochondrial n=1 Tax=Hyalella azteca TaxID=294128 RepID=A0A979FID8_HYAAZ|nr:microsomal glutathione S-transferase 3 [Hyalella azteca]